MTVTLRRRRNGLPRRLWKCSSESEDWYCVRTRCKQKQSTLDGRREVAELAGAFMMAMFGAVFGKKMTRG